MLFGGPFRGLLGPAEEEDQKLEFLYFPGVGKHIGSQWGRILLVAENGGSTACTVMLTAFAVPFR